MINTSGVKINIGTSTVRSNSVVSRGNTNSNLNNYKEIDYSDAALKKAMASGNKNTTTYSPKITIMEQTTGGDGGNKGTHSIASGFVSNSGSGTSTASAVVSKSTSSKVNALKSGINVVDFKG